MMTNQCFCFYILLVFVLSSTSCTEATALPELLDEHQLTNHTFVHNGLSRTYKLFVPEGVAKDGPLVFVLHGAAQTNHWAWTHTGMNGVAQKNKFVVCYPQGTISKTAKIAHWNACLNMSKVDDIGFLKALATHLQKQNNLSPKRTFICGLSNGGYMSYTMACEEPGFFRAIACVAGSMSGWTWEHCNPTVPTPVLHIHGTKDSLIQISGRVTLTKSIGWGGAPGVDSVVAYWAGKNGCTSKETALVKPYSHGTYYYNDENGAEVWYYRIENLGHGWPTTKNKLGIDSSTKIWEFFSKYL